MQTIRDLTTSAGRSEPRVWVERLMILASPGKDAEVIRDVALSKGVNFILAQEPALGTPRREVSGHSAGKTTFCRLLRYILGEQTFGTKINTQLISEAFPLGYVAAELHVLGRRWAVRRPFGGGRLSSILESASIEDLLRDGGTSVSREDYVKRLGFDDVLVPLPVRRVPRESVEITWHHLLAWCTRDQEARYQSIHDWRSPRSESGSPEFTFRKLSPLFAMRAALGVLPPNELGLENELAALDAQLDKVGAEIAETQRVPDYWSRHFERRLGEILRVGGVEAGGGADHADAGGLFANHLLLADGVADALRQDIGRLSLELEAAQAAVEDLSSTTRQYRESIDLVSLDRDLSLATAGSVSSSDLDLMRRRLDEIKRKWCVYGRVLFGDCVHIQRRQELITPIDLQMARHRELREAEEVASAHEAEGKLAQLRQELTEIEAERGRAIQSRSTIQAALRDRQRSLDTFHEVLQGIDDWTHTRRDESQEKVRELQADLVAIERQRTLVKDKLYLASSGAKTNKDTLNQIYAELVRGVIAAPTYDGQAMVVGREIIFRIVHGKKMSGEAIETLAVLLADLASMIYSCVSEDVSLPSFLLHDSPREADLSLRLYYGLLNAAVELEGQFGGPDRCPFQYVVTTTTPPPPELLQGGRLKLELDASHASTLLLKRDVSELMDVLPLMDTATEEGPNHV